MSLQLVTYSGAISLCCFGILYWARSVTGDAQHFFVAGDTAGNQALLSLNAGMYGGLRGKVKNKTTGV